MFVCRQFSLIYLIFNQLIIHHNGQSYYKSTMSMRFLLFFFSLLLLYYLLLLFDPYFVFMFGCSLSMKTCEKRVFMFDLFYHRFIEIASVDYVPMLYSHVKSIAGAAAAVAVRAKHLLKSNERFRCTFQNRCQRTK